MSQMTPYGAPGQMAATVSPRDGQPAALNLSKQVARIGEQCLWSTYAYSSGAGNVNAWTSEADVFAVGLGQAGQGWIRGTTRAETNLLTAGQIPVGLSFKVYGVAFHPYGIPKGNISGGTQATSAYPLDVADYNALQGFGVLQWRFQDTQIDVAPLQAIGAAGGIFGGTADTGAAYGGPGTTSAGSMVALNHGGGAYWQYSIYPVQLQAGVTLRMRINMSREAPSISGGPQIGDPATAAYDVAARVMLFGVYESAIVIA